MVGDAGDGWTSLRLNGRHTTHSPERLSREATTLRSRRRIGVMSSPCP